MHHHMILSNLDMTSQQCRIALLFPYFNRLEFKGNLIYYKPGLQINQNIVFKSLRIQTNKIIMSLTTSLSLGLHL